VSHGGQVLGLQKYKCIVFMYGDEHAPQDGETYMVIKQLQRDRTYASLVCNLS
jgi:hypothetical protein